MHPTGSRCVHLPQILVAVPCAIVSIVAATGSDVPSGVTCTKDLSLFLYIAFALCLAHITFAFYLFCVIGKEITEKREDNQHSSVYDRACHAFMYHPAVAVYIIIFVFSLIWGFIGVSWTGDEVVCKGSDLHSRANAIADWLLVSNDSRPPTLYESKPCKNDSGVRLHDPAGNIH